MLNILWGRSGSGKTTALLHEILARASAGQRGLIWLTPEPFSHECERMLAAAGGPAVCLSAEVLTFKRLCDRVFAAEGGAGHPVLDEGGRLLLMRRAVDAAGEGVTFWRRSLHRPEFLQSLLYTLDECKCYRLTPQTLLDAAAQAEGAAARKLSELALIFAAYDGETARSAADPRDRMELLDEKLRNGSFLQDKTLFVDGYVTFTPLELNVLLTCANRTSVTLALTGEPQSLTGRPEPPDTAVTRRTAEVLRRKAAMGKETLLEGNKRAQNPETAAVQGGERTEGGQDFVSAAYCVSPAAELDAAAQQLRAWVQEGFRWRDMAVLLPVDPVYAALAEARFFRHGVPVFMDSLDKVTDKPLARYLRASVDALEFGFRLSDVMTLLRTGLTAVDAEDADELENYLRLWKLKGRHWKSKERWDFPTEGYRAGEVSDRPGEEERLTRLHASRLALTEPLKALEGEGNALSWAHKFTNYLEISGLPQRLKTRAAALDALGERKSAEETRQLWAILVRALEQCAAVLGTMKLSRREFTELLLLVLSAYSVGSIPASLDRVSVSAAGRNRRLNIKAAVVLGCKQSLMPAFAPPESLLAPEERSALEALSAELSPDAGARLERARFDIYMSLCLPSERLFMTASPEADGKPALAAALTAALEASGGTMVMVLPQDPPEVMPDNLREPLTEPEILGLYGRDITLSASQLQQLFTCRQAYFLKYGLKARPRPEDSLSAPDKGAFLHYVLEQTGRRMLGKPPDARMAEVFAAEEAETYITRFMQGLKGRSSRYKRTFAALKRLAEQTASDVYTELEGAKFRPEAVELTFADGPDGTLPAVCVLERDGVTVKLRGKVDRVDRWTKDGRTYVRVADYKTSRYKNHEPKKLIQGNGMQLALYLKACTETMPEHPEPAGFCYVPARDEAPKTESAVSPETARELARKDLRREGILIADPDVLDAMEPMPEDRKCRFIPVQYNKPGKDGKSPLSAFSSVLDAEGFENLSRHLDHKLQEAGEVLLGGYTDANPLEGEKACELCEFKGTCFFDARRDAAAAYTYSGRGMKDLAERLGQCADME